MSKDKKIFIPLLVILVLLANASYAISYSFCQMTRQTSCYCSPNNDEEQGTQGDNLFIHSQLCCVKEVILINNSANFEQNNKVEIRIQSFIIHFPHLTNSINIHFTNSDSKEVLIFPQEGLDIPILDSSLLI